MTGKKEIVIVAGPCAVESQEQIMSMAHKISLIRDVVEPHNIHIKFRGGAWKPRTQLLRNGEKIFEGTREEGLIWLSDAAKKYNLSIVSEVMSEMDLRHLLLNSDNPLFISGIQALGAPLIKRYNLETLPLGYIIIDSGSTAAYIGQARALPRDKPEIAASFALAAQYLGMRFVYLEAGSGAKNPVPYEMISYVKDVIDIPLIVGGGIKTGEVAQNIVKSGADVIVTGTIIEYMQQEQDISSIIAAIHIEALN